MDKKDIAKNFNHVSNKYYEWNGKARQAAKEYLDSLLTEENPTIEFDNDHDDEYVTVCYDGGNHPEYASNAFSHVSAVYRKGNDICLDIEDTSDYSIDNISVDDLLAVCECVFYHFKNLQ